MEKIKTREQFLKAANLRFGDLHDYTNVTYVNSKTKVEILCKKHGPFYQNPNNFLSNNGCHKCAIDNKITPLRFTTSEICDKFKTVHNNRYNYSLVDYKGITKKVDIICTEHGAFSQLPHSHLAGNGCPLCGKGYGKSAEEKKLKDFVEKCSKIHNNFYDYSKSVYTKAKDKLLIVCPVHGEFSMTPNMHKFGNGCKQCYYDRAGYSKHSFVKACKDGVGLFYVLRCKSDSEEFIKIGITGRTVKKRYPSRSHMPYFYTVAQEVKFDAEYIWKLERVNLKTLKAYRYEPRQKFEGETECFTLDCLPHIKYKL